MPVQTETGKPQEAKPTPMWDLARVNAGKTWLQLYPDYAERIQHIGDAIGYWLTHPDMIEFAYDAL